MGAHVITVALAVSCWVTGCTSLLGVREPTQLPNQLTLESSSASGTAGTDLAAPIVVTLTDAAGDTIQGITVHFAVVTGGGAVSDADGLTDAEGHARTTLTLGTIAGTNSVEVQADGATTVVFTATGLVGPVDADQSTVSVNPPATVTADGAATSTITITVKDAFGNPIEGQPVTLAATGTGNTLGAPVATDAAGVTTGTIASTRAETKTITASSGAITFTMQPIVAFVAGAPASLVLVSGNNQTGAATTALASPFVVAVKDSNANGVPGVDVAFVVTLGGGSVSSASVTTDSEGRARSTLTLGSVVTTNRAEARVTGLTGTPVVFTAVHASFNVAYAAKDDKTVQGAQAIAVGDLDQDGKPDLVVAEAGFDDVAILLNTTPAQNATVSVAAAANLPVGDSPVFIGVVDLNQDGKLDLEIVNQTDKTVSIRLNTTTTVGSPTFAPEVTVATNNNPSSVAVGDFNGDGKPDLAISNRNNSSVSVYLSTTAAGAAVATFGAQFLFSTNGTPSQVVVGDIDGDGKLDLATANGSNTVTILRNATTVNSTTPSFVDAGIAPATGVGPNGIVIGDLDGDGKLDLAVANFQVNTASVLINTTTGGVVSFAPKVDLVAGLAPFAISIGDLNLDTKLDLVVANQNAATVSVMLNQSVAGTVSFASTLAVTTSTSPASIGIADLNADGKPDLAVACQSNAVVSILVAQ